MARLAPSLVWFSAWCRSCPLNSAPSTYVTRPLVAPTSIENRGVILTRTPPATAWSTCRTRASTSNELRWREFRYDPSANNVSRRRYVSARTDASGLFDRSVAYFAYQTRSVETMVVRSARRATGIHTVVFGVTVSVKSVRGVAGSLNTFESTPSSFKRNNGPKYNGPRCRWRAPR